MALKIPSFTAALTLLVPLSPKLGEKEMTREISIHQVQADWEAGAYEAADLTVLPGPCAYILSSSSCLIGQLPCWLTYTPGCIVIHCHMSLTATLLGVLFFLLQKQSDTPVSRENICPCHVWEPIQSPALQSKWKAVGYITPQLWQACPGSHEQDSMSWKPTLKRLAGCLLQSLLLLSTQPL